VKIKKTMTGGIILEVLGDKESDKAPALAARLTQALDSATVKVATPTRTAERRVTEIDISARRGF
jgi:hypothetical protein